MSEKVKMFIKLYSYKTQLFINQIVRMTFTNTKIMYAKW